MHGLARLQRLGLRGEDALVHPLRDLHEAHLAMQGDEGDAALVARLHELLGRPLERDAALEQHCGDPSAPGGRERPDEGLERLGLARPAGAGREGELAAVEQLGRAGPRDDVGPSDLAVEPSLARDELGFARLHLGELEHLRDPRQRRRLELLHLLHVSTIQNVRCEREIRMLWPSSRH